MNANTVFRHLLWFVAILVQLGCTSSGSQTANENLQDPGRPQMATVQGDFSLLGLPFEADALSIKNDRVLVIGSSGIASVDDENKVEILPPFKIVRHLLWKIDGSSKRGTVTKLDSRGPAFLVSSLCVPENGSVQASVLYVWAVCDHGDQIWKVAAGPRNTILKVISFSYFVDDQSIYFGGFRVMPKRSNTVMFSDLILDRPAILTEVGDFENLSVWWKGEISDGTIQAIDFVGEKGWKASNSGEISRSLDGGRTWTHLSSIELPKDVYVTDIQFSDAEHGYVLTDTGPMFTADGGNTWSAEDISSVQQFARMSVDEDMIVVRTSISLMFKNKTDAEWKKIDNLPGTRIADVVVFRRKVFILIDGLLYVSTI